MLILTVNIMFIINNFKVKKPPSHSSCPEINNAETKMSPYSLYKEPNIVEDIKIRRLERAGHIIRMEEERIPKKVLNGNFHTTRPVGRPRTGWADVVQRDALQLLGTRGWRRRAANRDEWRHLVREAKARKGM